MKSKTSFSEIKRIKSETITLQRLKIFNKFNFRKRSQEFELDRGVKGKFFVRHGSIFKLT